MATLNQNGNAEGKNIPNNKKTCHKDLANWLIQFNLDHLSPYSILPINFDIKPDVYNTKFTDYFTDTFLIRPTTALFKLEINQSLKNDGNKKIFENNNKFIQRIKPSSKNKLNTEPIPWTLLENNLSESDYMEIYRTKNQYSKQRLNRVNKAQLDRAILTINMEKNHKESLTSEKTVEIANKIASTKAKSVIKYKPPTFNPENQIKSNQSKRKLLINEPSQVIEPSQMNNVQVFKKLQNTSKRNTKRKKSIAEISNKLIEEKTESAINLGIYSKTKINPDRISNSNPLKSNVINNGLLPLNVIDLNKSLIDVKNSISDNGNYDINNDKISVKVDKFEDDRYNTPISNKPENFITVKSITINDLQVKIEKEPLTYKYTKKYTCNKEITDDKKLKLRVKNNSTVKKSLSEKVEGDTLLLNEETPSNDTEINFSNILPHYAKFSKRQNTNLFLTDYLLLKSKRTNENNLKLLMKIDEDNLKLEKLYKRAKEDLKN